MKPTKPQIFENVLKKLDTPSKEIAENMAFFRIMHAWFKNYFKMEKIQWLIEIGGGRGLVALAAMYLENIPRTTIIDQYMSKSCVRAMKAMADLLEHQLPEFQITKLEEFQFTPQGKTVLVGVHCCGSLTDELIEVAISHRIPFAVMPCCHKHNDPLITQAANSPASRQPEALDRAIDLLRLERARQKKYVVQIEYIDPQITPKNRVLLGYPREKNDNLQKTLKSTQVKATPAWRHLLTPRAKLHHLRIVLKTIGGGSLREYQFMGGQRNFNIKFVNKQGIAFILRISQTANPELRLRTLNQFERETGFYDYTRPMDIPVPRVHLIDASGKYLNDVFICMDCLPGVPLQTVLEYLPHSVQHRLLADAGKMLAKIHSKQLAAPGFLATGTGVIRGAFYATNIKYLQQSADAGLTGLKRKKIIDQPAANNIREIISSQYDILTTALDSCTLIHGDFDLTNILVIPRHNTWEISGLIDAEFAAAGDPGWDWMSLEFQSFARLKLKDAHKTFYQAYGQLPNLDAFIARSFVYRLIRINEYQDFFRQLNGKSLKEIKTLVNAGFGRYSSF